MSRPLWFVTLLKKFFPGRFLLARMTNQSLVGSLVDQALFAGDDMVYLPSDGSLMVGEAVPPAESLVLPSQVVDHFIETASYHWVMNFCICRESSGCSDYPREFGCLFLGEAVLKINPALGQLVSKEQALRHVRRCREAGLVHVVGRNKLDVIWLGAGPGEKLMTICNCCPCCCLWKVLPQITPRIGDKIRRMPGMRVEVSDLCQGCGSCCDEVCFVDAIHLVDGQAQIGEACRGCGRCVEECPNGAIRLVIDDPAYIENTIRRLGGQVVV